MQPCDFCVADFATQNSCHAKSVAKQVTCNLICSTDRFAKLSTTLYLSNQTLHHHIYLARFFSPPQEQCWMLFSSDESYLINEVQSKLGIRSKGEVERHLRENSVIGLRIGNTLVYHGQCLNEMILRASQTHEEAWDENPRRLQSRDTGGKFAASFCPQCETKLSRGKCSTCDYTKQND